MLVYEETADTATLGTLPGKDDKEHEGLAASPPGYRIISVKGTTSQVRR